MLGEKIKLPRIELVRIASQYAQIPRENCALAINIFEHALTSNILARLIVKDKEAVHALIYRLHHPSAKKLESEITDHCVQGFCSNFDLSADQARSHVRLMLSFWTFSVRETHQLVDRSDGTSSLIKVLSA